MKVLLSIDPVTYPLTGIGRYTYELGCGLQRLSLDDLLFLRGRRLHRELSMPASSPAAANWRDLKTRLQKIGPAVALFRFANAFLKGAALRGLEDHVFHGPNFYLPSFAGRSVATIHDLSVFLWPQCHPPERVRFMRAEIERTLKRATALITDTEYTRREVASYFGWPLERIHAVPLASSPEFRPRPPGELVPVLQPLGLDVDGYTLYAGTIEPRKNLLVLLDAYARLPEALRRRWPLVMAGYPGWNSDDIHERLQRAEHEGWLRYLGYVSDSVLPSLMAGARLFAFPSLYEGFGLPVLEAMACGVPVVCSNASTLPEVAGDAAAFHDPQDVDTLAQLLERGLVDETWRLAARSAGVAQASRFSWQRCAEQTLAVYEAVA